MTEISTALHGKAFTDWRAELESQTDRGAAIIGVAFLEARLEEAIRSRFVGVGEPTKALLNGDAPLATFRAKIDLGYALGLFGPRVHRDLNLMRKIRNKFAHQFSAINFDNADIRSQCSELWIPSNIKSPGDEPKSPRDNFVYAVLIIFGLLMTEMIDNRPQLNPPKFLPW